MREAHMTLLFLKNLEKMTLYRQNHGVVPMYRVKIKGQVSETALEKRREFCKVVRQCTGSSMQGLTCSLHVDIIVETRGQHGLIRDENKAWFIVNTVLGESHMSTQLRDLSQDKNLSYIPYVGIAIPYEDLSDFIGHVFCFLPLPLEERSLTGFPVHVNGFFALSQNRRHVKWPSADMKQSAISADKSLLWNQVLIEEALSQVYLTMVQELITKCAGAYNPVDLVAMVYRSIPCLHDVDVKWRHMLNPFVSSLLKTDCLYTENNGGQWISHRDAVFECPYYSTDCGVRDTLRQIMRQYRQNLVIVPLHVMALCEKKTSITKLTPAFLGSLLRWNNRYENCNSTQKLNLLQFLMSDNNYSLLNGLRLLPLENGSFVRFETYGCIYMCSEGIMKMLPGCGEQIVKQCIPQVIIQHLLQIQEKSMYQLRPIDGHGFAILLQLCMDRNLTDSGRYKIWHTEGSSLPRDWLENVWSTLTEFSLEHFKDMHLVPEIHDKYYHLRRLTGLFIVKSFQNSTLPDAISKSMARFSVVVLPKLPFFMAGHPEVTKYIHIPTHDSLLLLLDRLYTNNNVYLRDFNEHAGKEERNSWRTYVERFDIGDVGRTSLLRMQIFIEFQNDAYTSVYQVDTLAPQHVYDFPVRYHRRLLSSSDYGQYRLAQNLGATQLTEEAALGEILSESMRLYSNEDKINLMLHIIKNIHKFRRNSALMTLAREAIFMPNYQGTLRKPSELYDPSIRHLMALIEDNSLFPAPSISSSELLSGFRELGLKSSNPSRDLFNTCIKKLDRKANQRFSSNFEQAEAANHFLSQQSELLEYSFLIDKRFLVPLKRPPTYPTVLPWCPMTQQMCAPQECLLASHRNQRIVGSVMPLISEEVYGYLQHAFTLLNPEVTYVLKHLLHIKQKYEIKYKPDLLPCINEVYKFLAEQNSLCIKEEIRDFFVHESLVWTGETFVEVNDVYTTWHADDISLEPYMYCLPMEFQSIKHLFVDAGCHEKQTVEALIIVQEKIKSKHDIQAPCSKSDIEKDLSIIVQILKLFKHDPASVANLAVMFPVHTGSNDTQLQLMSRSECRYSNEEWLKTMADEEEETIYYVHADIPSDTAKVLGVRSLTEGLLTDTEAIQPYGQHEDLPGRIKSLLDGYTDGLSIPKEIIQNADDAAATTVCFLYDERENMDLRTRLIDENMAGFQGPALWAYNDAQFTETDLRNITKLGGATKEDDDTKIGKFGLGFCSVYNMTDVPSFITGSDLVIFDPHYRNLGSAVKGKEPGIKINLRNVQNQRLVRRMKNQFKPFNGVFGCDMTMGEDFHVYEGTLFRLPLRTTEQAGKSEIKHTAYSQSDMKELLHMLMTNGGNLLLFTQNVKTIEVYHLPADATDPSQRTLIYTVTKTMIDLESPKVLVSDRPHAHFNILKEASAMCSPIRHGEIQTHALQKIIEVDINIQVEKAAKPFTSYDVSDSRSSTRWIISYATGTSESLGLSKQVKGALPLAGVATPLQMNGCEAQLLLMDNMPFGFYKTGHYFSFLPLPLETGLSVHINATFAVAPDRCSIMWGTEDDKIGLFKPRWNNSLMTDAVPNAYVALLETLHNYNSISDEEYMGIWPIDTAYSDVLQSMQTMFLSRIIEKNPKVFKRGDLWVGFQDCTFMDPMLFESRVGDIAYKSAIQVLETDQDNNAKVMKLQRNLKEALSTADIEHYIRSKTMYTEDFFTEVLFPEMYSDFWVPRERNVLVMFAVDNMSDTIKNLLLNSKCIPSAPARELKHPHELIHPDSQLKNLFTSCEGKFVHKEMIKAGIKERKEQLADIGMIVDTLSRDLVLDRVKSVLGLSLECDKCAIERSVTIMQYVKEKCMSDTLLIEQLKHIPFLPILQKPKDWNFPWKAEHDKVVHFIDAIGDKKSKSNCNHVPTQSLQFTSPSDLYMLDTKCLVATQQFVFDMRYHKHQLGFSDGFFSQLGVKGADYHGLPLVPVEVVCKQLQVLCHHFDMKNEKGTYLQCVQDICQKIYKYLDTRMKHGELSEKERNCITSLKEHPVVFLGNRFVYPKSTAVKVHVNCSPLLFGLESHPLELHYKSLKTALSIKNQFTVTEIMLVILEEQEQNKKGDRLSKKKMSLFINLIHFLVTSMEEEQWDCERLRQSLKDTHGHVQLYLPDNDRALYPTDDLCLDDDIEIEENDSMRFVNRKIPPHHAQMLGVKSKERQQFSDYSEPFGPSEDLTTRLKNILRGYPCNEGIMKELLQNADDAQASEIHFITDFTNHSTEKVFDEKWKPLQGPALLVFNDSTFSAKDMQGIQDIGKGSKREDSTKTGQYGVGFNAVYHLTDAPSFITKGPDVEGGETMCVIDPYRQFISKATEKRPGTRLTNLNKHRARYSDVFQCYHEKELLKDKGTLFRFPLRQETSTENTKQMAFPLPQDRLEELLQNFEKEMLQTLLFVHSIRKISLSDISSGDLKPRYTVEAVISEEDNTKRMRFAESVKDFSKKMEENTDPSLFGSHSVSYQITMKENDIASETWLVEQHIGFGDGDIPDVIMETYKKKELGLLPRGGVAIPLLTSFSRFTSKAFCFLPLPILTGLPVHVNGHFALAGDTRDTIWHEKLGGYKWEWNKLLLTRIIPTAYIAGLERMKEMFLTDNRAPRMVSKTQQLDNVFPIFKNAKDPSWKVLVGSVLQQIYEHCHELFHFKCTNSHEKSALIQFVSLKDPNEVFPAVFNTFSKHMNTGVGLYDRIKRLVKIVKEIGLHLLDMPECILTSMKGAGITMEETSPEFLLNFLKSFNMSNMKHKCNIELAPGGSLISETSLHDCNAVLELLLFCITCTQNASKMVGVPLCLTMDGKLHTFQEKSNIFCSEFYGLLPSSSRLFLHTALQTLLATEQSQHILFTPFNVGAFGKLLTENIQEKYRNPKGMLEWDPDSKNIPNGTWIKNVWTFIKSQEENCPENTSEKDYMIQQLNHIASWCIVPCEMLTTSMCCLRKVLISTAMVGKALDIASFDGNLKDALNKLEIPVFDYTVPIHTNLHFSMKAGFHNPIMVLQCLYQNRNVLNLANVLESECTEILEYFAEHIQELKEVQHWIRMFKALPMHLTTHGEKVSLELARNVLVIPGGIPPEGMSVWAEKSQTLLLGREEKLKQIYSALGFANSCLPVLYINHVFPQIQWLPKTDLPVHLTYIRDYLLLKPQSNDYSSDQLALIEALKGLAVFDIGDGRQRRASELFCPNIEILKIMCDHRHFPPAPYNDRYWRTFMKLIGMKTIVPNELLIEFARQIELEGNHGISSSVKQKSETLLKCIWEKPNLLKESEFLHEICKIRFLVPHSLSVEMNEILPPFDAKRLMFFSGSVPAHFADSVWTSCCLLSYDAHPVTACGSRYNPNNTTSGDIAKCLGIHMDGPLIENVIQHTQNICDELHERCEKGTEPNSKLLMKIMPHIYEYLKQCCGQEENRVLRERLRTTPIVYLPTEVRFVACDRILIGLDESHSIMPYLYPAPEIFGLYYTLFELLGTARKATCNTYARVLHHLAIDVEAGELNVNEQYIVKRALSGLLNSLHESTSLDIPILYLPSKDYRLVDSTKLFYSDNDLFYNLIQENVGMPCFLGFSDLKLPSVNVTHIERLPQAFRPHILSKMVTKKLNTTDLEMTKGECSTNLQRFLETPEFVEGLLRMIYTVNPYEQSGMEDKVVSVLQRIQVLEVSSDLFVDLSFQGREIGTDTEDVCYLCEEDDGESLSWKLIIKVTNDNEWNHLLPDISEKFVQLISQCVGVDLSQYGITVIKVLMAMTKSETIPTILDKANIHQYNISDDKKEAMFLQCGSHVHQKWFHLLDNTISVFAIDEYVAVQLSIEGMSDFEDPGYIYARIVGIMKSEETYVLSRELTQYSVDIGGTVVNKYAFELFKFHRKNTSRELVPAIDVTDVQSTTQRHIQSVFREIRKKLIAI